MYLRNVSLMNVPFSQLTLSGVDDSALGTFVEKLEFTWNHVQFCENGKYW